MHSVRMKPMSRHSEAKPQSRQADNKGPVGPQGGTTTVTENRVRKTVYLDKETVEHIVADARKHRRPEAFVIRDILNEYYGISFDDDEESESG